MHRHLFVCVCQPAAGPARLFVLLKHKTQRLIGEGHAGGGSVSQSKRHAQPGADCTIRSSVLPARESSQGLVFVGDWDV